MKTATFLSAIVMLFCFASITHADTSAGFQRFRRSSNFEKSTVERVEHGERIEMRVKKHKPASDIIKRRTVPNANILPSPSRCYGICPVRA